ncbi:MAG: hypothetical protein AAFR47_08685 [Pseudomonadota bacterium]
MDTGPQDTNVRVRSRMLSGVMDVLDDRMVPIQRVHVTPFQDTEFELGPGEYHVEMRLNDGRRVRDALSVVPSYGEPGIDLVADDMVHEWTTTDAALSEAVSLEMSGFARVSTGLRAVDGHRARLWEVPSPAEFARARGEEPPEAADAPEPSGVRIAARAGGDAGLRLHRSYGPMDPALALEVEIEAGGGRLPPLVVLLPRFSFALTVEVHKPGEAPKVGVQVGDDGGRVEDGALQMMLDLLANPAPDAPEMLYDWAFQDLYDDGHEEAQVREMAVRFAQDKFIAPDLAAAAGWYLMRINRLGAIRDWPRNMADYFPELPDGAVLDAWRRLEAGDDGNPPYPDWRVSRPPPATRFNPDPAAPRPEDPVVDAAMRLTGAAHRGPPRFAKGVRQLALGLDWCARSLEPAEWPEGMEAAQRRAKRWDRALLPGTAFAAMQGSAADLDIGGALALDRIVSPGGEEG